MRYALSSTVAAAALALSVAAMAQGMSGAGGASGGAAGGGAAGGMGGSGTAPGGAAGSSAGTAGGAGSAAPAAPSRGPAPTGGAAGSGTGTSAGAETAGGPSGPSTGVTLTPQQRTQITRSFTSVNVRPVTGIDVSIAVGTVIPDTIELHEVPVEVVKVAPDYRGYRYFVVGNQIVIVEPKARRIVAVIERTG